MSTMTCPKCQKSFDSSEIRKSEQSRCPHCSTRFRLRKSRTSESNAASADGEPVRERTRTSGAHSEEAQTPELSPTVTFEAGQAKSGSSEGKRDEITSLGNYEILDEIARGGMGIVYRARQQGLDRLVALKTIRAGEFADDQEVQRFRIEAEAAAKLRHPNIVTVFEVGEDSGRQFLAMELVEGPNLQTVIQKRQCTSSHVAKVVGILAEAIAYAHSQGVIHRDLKPSNILIGQGGQPQVTDFGLARTLDRDTNLTVTGQVIGTPTYMAPEQAAGQSKDVGPAADIYALGGILYFCLIGKPPFEGDSLSALLQKVIHEDPVSPRVINSKVHTAVR